MPEPNRAKASAAYSEQSDRVPFIVIEVSSTARDQPGRGAPLPQLPGQVVGVLDGLRGVLPPSPPVGRRVDDTSRVAACKEHPAGRHGTAARDLGTDVEP
jgi:hypothetical protein